MAKITTNLSPGDGKSETNFKYDLTVIFGPCVTGDNAKLIRHVAEKQDISPGLAWQELLKEVFLGKERILDGIFSEVCAQKIELTNVFVGNVPRFSGPPGPSEGVASSDCPIFQVELSDIVAEDNKEVISTLKDEKNRNTIGAVLGKLVQAEWVYVSFNTLNK